MRVLTIISGILFVLVGVFCFANPGETFLSLAFILGLMMVINSIIQGIAYWRGRRGTRNDNNGWIMAEAIITFILGILVLSSQIAADVAIPMVFGMWVMFSGILRVVTATTIDRVNKKVNFMWTMVTGLICAAGGLYAFLNPVMAGLAIAVLLGILFVLQGISTLELGIHMPHEIKEKRPKSPQKPKKPGPPKQREQSEKKKQPKVPKKTGTSDRSAQTRKLPVSRQPQKAEQQKKPPQKPGGRPDQIRLPQKAKQQGHPKKKG